MATLFSVLLAAVALRGDPFFGDREGTKSTEVDDEEEEVEEAALAQEEITDDEDDDDEKHETSVVEQLMEAEEP